MLLKRIALRTVLLMAAVVLVLPLAVSAQDAEAVTEPVFLLTIVDDGETVQGEFVDTTTAQLYTFLGKEGDVITVEMVQEIDSTLDPYIVILGPYGQVLGKDDDSGDLQYSARFETAELPMDGLYFVLASSFNYINTIIGGDEPIAEPLKYAITISGQTGTDEDGLQYFASELAAGDELIGYSNEDEPVFYFDYLAEEAETTIDVTVSSTEFDTLLMVFGPGGNRVAVNDDVETGTTNSAVRGVELPEAGVYVIFATDIYFTSVGDDSTTLEYKGGDFTITLNAGE